MWFDTNIARPSAQITVTYSSGIREIRKLFVREQLDITGGELIVNCDPDYPSNTAQYPNALRSGSVSAQFTQPVSLSGSGSILCSNLLDSRAHRVRRLSTAAR